MSADTDSVHFHVHYDYAERDCDGMHYDNRIIQPSDMYAKMSGYAFKCYQIGTLVRTWEPGGTVTVPTEDVVTWYAKTDEGFESKTIQFCDDSDCLPLTDEERHEEYLRSLTWEDSLLADNTEDAW